jgi:hypothetical protein
MTWPLWEKQVASAVQSVPVIWKAGIGNGEIPTWNGSERAERAITGPMHHLLCQGR